MLQGCHKILLLKFPDFSWPNSINFSAVHPPSSEKRWRIPLSLSVDAASRSQPKDSFKNTSIKIGFFLLTLKPFSLTFPYQLFSDWLFPDFPDLWHPWCKFLSLHEIRLARQVTLQWTFTGKGRKDTGEERPTPALLPKRDAMKSTRSQKALRSDKKQTKVESEPLAPFLVWKVRPSSEMPSGPTWAVLHRSLPIGYLIPTRVPEYPPTIYRAGLDPPGSSKPTGSVYLSRCRACVVVDK